MSQRCSFPLELKLRDQRSTYRKTRPVLLQSAFCLLCSDDSLHKLAMQLEKKIGYWSLLYIAIQNGPKK